MVEKFMTLEEAVVFDKIHRLSLAEFGFIVTYEIEEPIDKHGDIAFGIFTGVMKPSGVRFTCDVDGVFDVIYATSAIVRIT